MTSKDRFCTPHERLKLGAQMGVTRQRKSRHRGPVEKVEVGKQCFLLGLWFIRRFGDICHHRLANLYSTSHGRH